MEMMSSQHKECLGSWCVDELQTVNLSHLCCMFKRCWVMLIPAGCWTSPPCFPETCRPVYPGCVRLQIQAPWETCNQRTHYLRQVCCTRACLQSSGCLTLSPPLSLALLWRSHRAAIELHSLWLPAPSSDGRWGCVHSLGWLGLRRGQTNAVAWQANWETLLCEQCVCGARAPEVWISFKGVFKVSFNSLQSVLKVACINKPGSL